MDKNHKILIKSIIYAIIGLSVIGGFTYTIVANQYDENDIHLPVAYYSPESPESSNSQYSHTDTLYIKDTLYITQNDINLDPYSCGDDAKIFPRRCTADISREILEYCDSKDMGWIAFESGDDKRTVSLLCDGFEKSTRTDWKRE